MARVLGLRHGGNGGGVMAGPENAKKVADLETIVAMFRAWLQDNASAHAAEFRFTVVDGQAKIMRARHSEDVWFVHQAEPAEPAQA